MIGQFRVAQRIMYPRPRRTPTYTRSRGRRPIGRLGSRIVSVPASRARPTSAGNTRGMFLDRPASLPTATARARSPIVQLASRLRGTRAAGWRWLRPRMVPVAVALTGMFLVLGSAEYLTRLARRTPATDYSTSVASERAPSTNRLPSATNPIHITGVPGATVVLDGNPSPVGHAIQMPAQPLFIRLVPLSRTRR